MNYVLTNSEMREADRYTIDSLGVASLTLMERAGGALAVEAERLAQGGKILCVCSGGNNGGDGFVCARILKEKGVDVEVLCYAEKLSDDCRINKEKWQSVGGNILTEITKKYSVLVDCLYGTGFHGSLAGKDKETVLAIHEQRSLGAKVLSADIPSGINGNNGRAHGEAVAADVTLCIGEKKTGALLNDGLDFCGECKRVDIGITLPKKAYAVQMTEAEIRVLLPKRKRNTHKGSYGRAAIVGGCMEYTGAAYLSAAACLRSGAGYTTLFTPAECLPYYLLKAPEILLKSTNEGSRYEFILGKAKELLAFDSIAYGMGMGISEAVAKGAAYLLGNYTGKLLLDADGLNSLATFKKEELKALFSAKKCDVIITPHIKEFSRISGKDMEEIVDDPIACAKDFAREYNVSVLLKNASTVITDGEHTTINTTGNSGQAKGGSGDVLSGLIAGLCASGLSAYHGGVVGAWLAGKAAELAALETSEYALTASDVISYLGRVFLLLD